MGLAQRVDETQGLTLVRQDAIGSEQTRYLFTALDAIEPDRKYQVDTLRAGGEEVASRCLRRTPNYIPRCEFTPLEVWFEPIGIAELVPEGVRPVTLKQENQPALPDLLTPGQFFRRNEPAMGIQHFPGEDLPLIIEVTGYRGVKEIGGLRGKEWDSGEAKAIEAEFFPTDWEMPIALRLIENRIKEVGFQPYADQMLMSCDQSRRWATERINLEHGLLATRKEHQHTYRYSRLAPQLLAQLEMSPKDQGSEATQLAQAIVKEFLAAQSPTHPTSALPATINIESIVEAAVRAALGAKEAVAQSTTKEHKCAACGESFDTPQGLAMHSRRWCKAEKS